MALSCAAVYRDHAAPIPLTISVARRSALPYLRKIASKGATPWRLVTAAAYEALGAARLQAYGNLASWASISIVNAV